MVTFGNLRSANGRFPVYETIFEATRDYSRHYSIIFNTFVCMQIFNFLNSRKLYDEINIFQGISRNKLFFLIVGVILVVQGLLITFTSTFFNVYPQFGLSGWQWLICFGFGAFSLVISVFLKILPIGKEIISKARVTSDIQIQ